MKNKAQSAKIKAQSSKRKIKAQTCYCDRCRRQRRYYRNTARLPKAERDWMRGFYEAATSEL